MGNAKRKLTEVGSTGAFSIPDVAMTPEQQFILDGLVLAALEQRRLLQQAEQRCTAFVIRCAVELGVNSPQYKFDPEKRIFARNTESTTVFSDKDSK